MEERKTLFIFMLILFVLTACSPADDPRNVADAYATQAEADRLNAVNEYDLNQREIVDTIENTEKQTRLDVLVSVKADLMVAARWSVILLSIVFIPTVGIYIWKTGQTAVVVTQRVAFALADKAEVQAQLIWMDKATRSLPVQLREIDGLMYVINHNSGAKFLLTGSADIEPTPQMLAGFYQSVTAGLLAQEARKDRKKDSSAAHYAAIQPNIITADEMTGELVEVN